MISREESKINCYLNAGKYKKNVFEIIDNIKTYITLNDCSQMYIDIKELNLLDAVKVAILCSTYHFTKYPKGNVSWLVKDDVTLKTIKPLQLKNTQVEVLKKKFITREEKYAIR